LNNKEVKMKTNFIKMSVAAAMLLGSSAYAGKIIGITAGTPWEVNVTNPPQQYGYGGWNLGNVEVRMVDAETGALLDKSFYESDGTYDEMTYGDSFRSDITVSDVNTTVMGILGGKDWPVGEPAGIKVVNDDAGTAKSGKSPNCIMTTSYLDAEDSGTGESGYLDAANPVPTVCSSPFQTHKRFKVSMQPTTVNGIALGAYGKPFDLTFNLDQTDEDPAVRRYQVFQKINNYTDKRLNGYKIELLDENGALVNGATDDDIKFSTLISTKQESDESGDRATFSHGLWGPYEEKDGVVKFDEGFFDIVRAGFVQAPMDESNTTLVGGPETLGSNYEALFGLWLPYSWAPYGIFFDDDNDPLTDAELVAFWGTAPDAAPGTPPAWLKGQADNWAPVTPAPVTPKELLSWMTDPLYSQSKIEDTVNLGLDYVVEVGLNQTIGSKFTIRITPRVAENQTAPSYIDGEGNYIMPPTDYNGTEVLLVIAPTPTFMPVEQNLSVGVADTTKNQDQNGIEEFDIVITTTSGDEENLTLTETDVNSSVFIGTISTDENTVVKQDGTVSVKDGTVVTATYGTLTAITTADDGTTTPPPSDDYNPSSGGGGCTYNPDSKSFDIGFLVMMALGLLYPFRRRFIK